MEKRRLKMVTGYPVYERAASIGFNKLSHENICGKRAASGGAGLNVSGPAKEDGLNASVPAKHQLIVESLLFLPSRFDRRFPPRCLWQYTIDAWKHADAGESGSASR